MSTRPPHIVSVCYRGRDPKSSREDKARYAAMEDIAQALAGRADWQPLDAVLFPGGFLFAPVTDTDLLIDGGGQKTPVAKATRRFLAGLPAKTQIVLGIDTAPYRAHERLVGGQQLALAFNRQGLSGFARKIFPINEDVDGKTMPPFITHEKDFSDPRRIITLAQGSRALLNVCYDMFGIGVAARNLPDKLHKVAMLEDAQGQLLDKKEAWPVLEKAFGAYRDLLASEKPDTALGLIHRFAAPGREGFWQRHGIASASAGLRGGFALAAAHVGTLSDDPHMTRLMSSGVPAKHLEQAGHRQAHIGDSADHIVGRNNQGQAQWIARLYKP